MDYSLTFAIFPLIRLLSYLSQRLLNHDCMRSQHPFTKATSGSRFLGFAHPIYSKIIMKLYHNITPLHAWSQYPFTTIDKRVIGLYVHISPLRAPSQTYKPIQAATAYAAAAWQPQQTHTNSPTQNKLHQQTTSTSTHNTKSQNHKTKPNTYK